MTERKLQLPTEGGRERGRRETPMGDAERVVKKAKGKPVTELVTEYYEGKRDKHTEKSRTGEEAFRMSQDEVISDIHEWSHIT